MKDIQPGMVCIVDKTNYLQQKEIYFNKVMIHKKVKTAWLSDNNLWSCVYLDSMGNPVTYEDEHGNQFPVLKEIRERFLEPISSDVDYYLRYPMWMPEFNRVDLEAITKTIYMLDDLKSGKAIDSKAFDKLHKRLEGLEIKLNFYLSMREV